MAITELEPIPVAAEAPAQPGASISGAPTAAAGNGTASAGEEPPLPRKKKANVFSKINEESNRKWLANQELKRRSNRLSHFNVVDDVKCMNKYSLLSASGFERPEVDHQPANAAEPADPVQSVATSRSLKKKRKAARSRAKRESAAAPEPSPFAADEALDPVEAAANGAAVADYQRKPAQQPAQASDSEEDLHDELTFETEEVRLRLKQHRALLREHGQCYQELDQLQPAQEDGGYLRSRPFRLLLIAGSLLLLFACALRLCMDTLCPCKHGFTYQKLFGRLLKRNWLR